MGRRRFRRKDLKRPDVIISHGWQAAKWASEHSQTLSWALAGVVVVALILAAVGTVRSARKRQANADLGHALAEFQSGQYANAATQLAEVANRWQGTETGRLAALYAANADLKSGNPDGAKALLEPLASRSDWPSYLRQEVLFDFGIALERKGDTANAARRYEEASALEGPYAAPALLAEARCREQLGEKDKATALYQRYARDFPDGAEADMVTAKVGPAAPPAAS